MRKHRGFTLIELLVALTAMAILAVLAWRGLDGMTRAQAITAARSDETLTLQTGLAQWGADLDAMEQISGVKSIDWNGRVLRLTRRSTAQVTDGVIVVGWTRRVVGERPMWLRWQSPPATTRNDLDSAWQRADLWSQNQAGNDAANEVAVTPLEDWQIFFFRDNAWTNPQSSGISVFVGTVPNAVGVPAGVATGWSPPDGVRLVLTLPPDQTINGTLTRDWVRPQVTP